MQITNCGRGVHKREVVGIERLRRLPSDWYGFTNLDLATGPGRSREIDLVLVAEDRIFLIDLKDWHGRIDSDNGNWLHNGRDTGPSPVGKIHQNAKDVGYLLTEHVKRHMRGTLAPRVVGLIVITGNSDLSGIAGTERGSVFTDENFIAEVCKPGSRVAMFGAVAREFVDRPLTEVVWKDQLGKFFNARTGRISPGRRRYANFLAASDDATFEHPGRIYAEYEAFDENAAQTLGTLRVWDFSRAETRFQSEEARSEIAGRERSVVEFLKDFGEACENAVLHPRAEDPDRGVSYWEVFDRRQRLKRLSEFVNAEAGGLDRERRIELARQLIARVAALHAAGAAHLDLGGHSVWLESPSTVKLSHLMAAQYAQVESLGKSRYQFLASAKLPEDVLGGENHPKRKDVFLLAAAVHWLLFGVQPKSGGDDMPFEWDPKADADGRHSDLHAWLERGLSLAPQDRFRDATAALDAFNAATASRPSAREVIEGLERFRGTIRSQKQFFAAYPETASLREGDRLDVWRSEREGQPVLVKLWKRAAWGDQTREGPRILDFLTRARDLALSPPPGCGRVLDAFWLSDAIAIVQAWVEGPDLSEALKVGSFVGAEANALKFALDLANGVDSLHELGLTHGDLKPQNVIVAAQDDGRPVLIDLVDFSSSDDGDIQSNAYAPASGGRMERDRFAVTRIVEELFGTIALPMTVAADIATSIAMCRDSAPENGTLLPLIEALERGLDPRPAAVTHSALKLAIQGASVGPLLPDEGAFHIRRGLGRPSFFIRGACEEIEVFLDNAGRPLRARRAPLDQKRIGRLARLEFMPFTAEVAVVRSDITELSDLSKLMDDPAFVAGWAGQSARKAETPAADDLGEPDPEPAFEDAAFDRLSEVEVPRQGAERIDIRRLWRALIDAEGELTTDGVAQADSAYNRDLRRHIVPFELTSGTFDFNRNDRVGVERLDRKGAWRRIGELDIARSRPDRVLIDATELAIANQASLVEGDQRIRFTSHFQVQSLKRRESAISRILAGEARIAGLSAAFEAGTAARPNLLSITATAESLSRYELNAAQKTAFQKLLAVRPLGALQGPPGTGKTHFISALAHYALTHGLAKNILLASQSHEAVNNAAEAVLRLFAGQDEQPSILRVGNEGVVSERLMPFHTDRLEQLYKDRFRAEMRERLRIVGRALGLPPSVVEVIIGVETTLRPAAEKLIALRSEKEPDLARINSLADTLTTQAMHLAPPGADVAVDDEDPFGVLDAVVSAAVHELPPGERPAPERMGKLRALVQVARDFVGSVSTQQRGFEAFLAGTRQIVAGTCVGLGRASLGLTATPFDLVIIDEAARCTASELAVPMQAGRWVVLVGDHAQLEPQHHATVVSKVAADIVADELDVVRSDFERLFANGYGTAAGARLKTQYRMLPAIGQVVSDTFYGGELEPGRTTPVVDPGMLPSGLETPITWITTDCLGELGAERAEETGTSRVNPAEADAIVSLLKAWGGHKPFVTWAAGQVKHAHVIGVICMYAAQRDLIRRKVQAANLPEAFRRIIKIDTVDSYQGKENPIVILSLVRNNTQGAPERGLATIKAGFLGRPNRINVAVSRAMDRLVIVGAKSRWRVGTPMQRLAEAVELRFQAGEAKIIPASAVLDGGADADTPEAPALIETEA
ncbi:MAG: NERD domain-containing protein [Phenylobacterium sp.]|uniref:AAA domain-containing protein n=1 Tax=Phenylobacterium sp. TaxID=1871053 RepID=UPI001B621515|nr:AAA domain-containing protein [Phenylobacterium sp.]MBP7818062.1 NERD domain-containing protein [Phenylobacterium sp.]